MEMGEYWLIWTIFSLWLFPAVLAIVAVPHPFDAYGSTSWLSLGWMGVMGFVWGIGALMLGIAFDLVGVAVAAAVALGCSAAMGTILPLLRAAAPPISKNTVLLIMAGLAIVLFGVAICGYAGRARERQQGTGKVITGRAFRGLLYASIGGTMTAALNLAFVSGPTIMNRVTQQHPATELASIAVWVPILAAGGIPGVAYTGRHLKRNRSHLLYRSKGTRSYWLLALLMSVLWLGSVVFYGMGATRVGSLGPVVGWPAFMSGAVIFSAAWGALFGEWRNAGIAAKSMMTLGVLCLMAAIVVLAEAGH